METPLLATGLRQLRQGYGGPPFVPLWGEAKDPNCLFAEYVSLVTNLLRERENRTVVLRPDDKTCAFIYEEDETLYNYVVFSITDKDDVVLTNIKGDQLFLFPYIGRKAVEEWLGSGSFLRTKRTQ
jgi:hypothetical protein